METIVFSANAVFDPGFAAVHEDPDGEIKVRFSDRPACYKWTVVRQDGTKYLCRYSKRTGNWTVSGPEAKFMGVYGLEKFLPRPLLGFAEKDVQIIRVEGPYGQFEGPEALERYRHVKTWWQEATRDVHDALETIGVFDHGGWWRPGWAQQVHRMARHPEYELGAAETEVAKISVHPMLKRAYGALNDRVRGWPGANRLTMRQFATLVAYFRKGSVSRPVPL